MRFAHLILLLGVNSALAVISASTEIEINAEATEAPMNMTLMNATMELLQDGNREIQLSENHKDLMLLVGLTGSGKSTMAHLLTDQNMTLEAYEVDDEILIRDVGKKIRDGTRSFTSKTLFPDLIVDNETGQAMYDCPGFMDVRNTSVTIANGFFIKKLVGHAESIKILVVVQYDDVMIASSLSRSRFLTLLTRLLQFMRNVPNYKGAIALLVTKLETSADDTTAIKRIASFLEFYRPRSKEEHFPDRKTDLDTLFDSWLEKDSQGKYVNLDFFRQPTETGMLGEMPKVRANRDRLRQMVFNNTHFTPVPCKAFDFGIPVSREATADIQKIQLKLNAQVNEDLLSLSTGIRDRVSSIIAASSSLLTESTFDAILKACSQVTVSSPIPGLLEYVLKVAIDLAKSLGVPKVNETAKSLTDAYGNLKSVEILQPHLKSLEYRRQQQVKIVSEVLSIRTRIDNVVQDTVVQHILSGRPGAAASWLKKLGLTGDMVANVVDRAYARLPSITHLITGERVVTALPIVKFLSDFKTSQPFATHGVLHLIGKLKTSNRWSGVYLPFKQLLSYLQNPSLCSTTGTQLGVYLFRHELQKAPQSFVSPTAQLIRRGNPSTAKDLFINELGDNQLEAFKSVVALACQSGSLQNHNHMSNILSFIQLFNKWAYSAEGMKILFYAIRSQNLIPNEFVFKLRAYFQSMALTDATLRNDLEAAIGQMYGLWSTYLLNDCDQLIRIEEREFGGPNFNASEVVSRDNRTSTATIVRCIRRMYNVNRIRGYEGLFKKLERLSRVSSYDYLDAVESFKTFVASIGSSHSQAVQEVKAAIPANIRHLFFCTSNIYIVNRGNCLGVQGESFLHVFAWKYNSHLYSSSFNSDCRMKLTKRPDHPYEYMITSARTKTYLYVEGGWQLSCGENCRNARFWGYTDSSGSEKSWFKFRPQTQGTQFSISNTYYPGTLNATKTGEIVVSEDRSSIDGGRFYSWQLWSLQCS